MEISPLIRYITFELNHASSLALSIDEHSDKVNLHDFRVTIRKCRSLLILFFKEKKLKKIVKKTNILRELDMFLLTLSSEKYPKLYKSISKARYNYFRMIWTDEFIKESINILKNISNELLYKKCDYSVKDLIAITYIHFNESKNLFNKITEKDSSKTLHKIRIHYKCSRYALEFLDQSKISCENEKIQKCKESQEFFGRIQDASNQLDWLISLCSNNNEKECLKLIEYQQNKLEELKKIKK